MSEFWVQIVLVLRSGGHGMGTFWGYNADIFWWAPTNVRVKLRSRAV